MKISIIGGGNMGGAIAYGLATTNIIEPSDITVINRKQEKVEEFNYKNKKIKAVANNYDSLNTSDIIILAVKPWILQDLLSTHKNKFNKNQIFISIASGIALKELSEWIVPDAAIFRVMPNTAIEIKESMSFVTALNANEEQKNIVDKLFSELGKVQFIEEKLFSAATAHSGCGIALAFRYIRAAMEAGVEMGIKANDAKKIIIQTIRGAADLLETNESHPEVEIDKVTTPGGITIKGINELEQAGFTAAVIRGHKPVRNKEKEEV